MLGFGSVLVAFDFSPASRVALRSSRAALAPGGRLHVLHVVEPLPARYAFVLRGIAGRDLERLRTERAEHRLSRVVRRFEKRSLRTAALVRFGKPWQELLAAARETGAELICLGGSALSRFERLLLGSTAGAVVRRSPVPVLVTRRRLLSRVRRVFLPVDFDAGSERAARFVAERLPSRAAIHALFVVPPPLSVDPRLLNYVADEKAIERDLRGFLSSAGLGRARYEVRMFGEPAGEILRAARRVGADLIVISTHGRSGLPRHLLGSVAEKVVHDADRPVLVLPLTPPTS